MQCRHPTHSRRDQPEVEPEAATLSAIVYYRAHLTALMRLSGLALLDGRPLDCAIKPTIRIPHSALPHCRARITSVPLDALRRPERNADLLGKHADLRKDSDADDKTVDVVFFDLCVHVHVHVHRMVTNYWIPLPFI